MGCTVGVSVVDNIETEFYQQGTIYQSKKGTPLSVPPSHGLRSSWRPAQPFSCDDRTTSSEVRTAMRGERDWRMERGGDGIESLLGAN